MLNLTRNAPNYLIRSVYGRLSQKALPDVNPDDVDATAKDAGH